MCIRDSSSCRSAAGPALGAMAVLMGCRASEATNGATQDVFRAEGCICSADAIPCKADETTADDEENRWRHFFVKVLTLH
eukprot:2896371-Pyramimonas_sp.AAC.1